MTFQKTCPVAKNVMLFHCQAAVKQNTPLLKFMYVICLHAMGQCDWSCDRAPTRSFHLPRTFLRTFYATNYLLQALSSEMLKCYYKFCIYSILILLI